MHDVDHDQLYATTEGQRGYFTAGQALGAGMDRSTLNHHARLGGREVSGVTATSPERTIVDCIDDGTQPEQVELAIRQALRRGLTTTRRLTGAAALSARARDLVDAVVRQVDA